MPPATRIVAGVLVLAGLAGGVVLSQRIASGQMFPGSGDAVKMVVQTATAVTPSPCTTSNVFDFVPDTTVTFRSDRSGPAVVLFSVTLRRENGAAARLRFRFLVDMTRGAVIWAVPVGAAAGPTAGRAVFHFVTEPLAAGTHVVAVQWNNPGEEEVCLGRRELVVFFR